MKRNSTLTSSDGNSAFSIHDSTLTSPDGNSAFSIHDSTLTSSDDNSAFSIHDSTLTSSDGNSAFSIHNSALILASGSPRRREILSQLGIKFRVLVSGEEENPKCKNPLDYPRENAVAKAMAVSRKEAGAVVLGFDTLVFLNDKPLGKPKDAADALRMLRALNGRSHKVITGVAIVQDGIILDASEEETEVIFRENSQQDLENYVNSKDPLDKAGAYGIQTQGARLIHSIRGCYYNVVGLPVARTLGMLEKLKLKV